MQNNMQQSSHQPTSAHNEEILVLKRSLFFEHKKPWDGILAQTQQDLDLITNHVSFMPRCHAETDIQYKQIIPYMLFLFEKKLFVMQRKKTASEQRLAGKFSLGIGGHIRQEDIQNANIIDWADREFQEEVTYHGSKTVEIIGLLNDDSNDVGKVHLGIIMLIQANSDQISINDEHKSGTLLNHDECLALRPYMESWSQMCLDFLISEKIL